MRELRARMDVGEEGEKSVVIIGHTQNSDGDLVKFIYVNGNGEIDEAEYTRFTATEFLYA